jgi:hypothetical protein
MVSGGTVASSSTGVAAGAGVTGTGVGVEHVGDRTGVR